MNKEAPGDYSVSDRAMIVETPDLRVQLFTLAAGEEVPWHYHTVISDTFFCLDGPMVVQTKAADGGHELQPGEKVTVTPPTAHRVAGKNDGSCRFVLVQETGPYDRVMLDE